MELYRTIRFSGLLLSHCEWISAYKKQICLSIPVNPVCFYLADTIHLFSSGHTPALLFGNFNLVFSSLNSLFILSFGLISLIILDTCKQQKPITGHLFGLGIAGGLTILSWMIHCEYCFLGIPLIIAFYEANLFKKSDYCKKRVTGAIIQLLLGTLVLILYIFLTCITDRNEFFYALIYGICQFGALLFIFLYNGKQGCQNKFIKYCFYCFYPVHMIILILLRVISL